MNEYEIKIELLLTSKWEKEEIDVKINEFCASLEAPTLAVKTVIKEIPTWNRGLPI